MTNDDPRPDWDAVLVVLISVSVVRDEENKRNAEKERER